MDQVRVLATMVFLIAFENCTSLRATGHNSVFSYAAVPVALTLVFETVQVGMKRCPCSQGLSIRQQCLFLRLGPEN